MPAPLEIPVDLDPFDNFKNGNEIVLTYSLKYITWKWLWEVPERRVVGFEVRLKEPLWLIADILGFGLKNRIFLIEVKSSMDDLRRDDNKELTQKKLAPEDLVAGRRGETDRGCAC